MKRTALELLTPLQQQYVQAERTMQRVDTLVSARKLTEYDADQIYCGIFLSAFVSFEQFIEELFVGYLLAKTSPVRSKVRPLLVIPNRDAVKAVLNGKRPYVDWLPYAQTRERAEIFFVGTSPFAAILPADLQMMDEVSIVRNVLAHKSKHAKAKFSDKVIGSTPLKPRERTPEGYLRSALRSSPPQNRLQNYLAQMLSVANKLCQ